MATGKGLQLLLWVLGYITFCGPILNVVRNHKYIFQTVKTILQSFREYEFWPVMTAGKGNDLDCFCGFLDTLPSVAIF